MSTSILDRPTSARTTDRPAVRTAPAVGSYVDTDGVRRAPQVVGTYTGRAVGAVGSYTDRDGARRAHRVGTYTSAQR